MTQPFNTTFPILNQKISEGIPLLERAPKLFDIDNIAAYWIQHDDETFDISSEAGPLRLPYKTMWVEHGKHLNAEQSAWSIAKNGKKVERYKGQRKTQGVGTLGAGCLLREIAPDTAERTNYLRYMQLKDHDPNAYLLTGVFFDKEGALNRDGITNWISEDGKWITSMVHSGESLLYRFAMNAGQPELVMHEIRAAFNPIAMAIGLMNCRNIESEDRVTKPVTKRKHRKRITTPGTEYKVIRLPGAPSNRVDGKVEISGSTRYHTVRGHFKTYTEEKPLYGKLTGTWWWAPSVRGKKENGEIISTYKQDVA